MNEHLERFLAATDLDEAMEERFRIERISTPDRDAVCDIIAEWYPPQAIANLLMHPALLLDGERFPALMRGLDERKEKYFVLAAVVGLQSFSPADEDEHQAIVRRLIPLIRKDDGVIARRASISIARYIQDSDLPEVTGLLQHPDDIVRHNLLNALVRYVGIDSIDELVETAHASGRIDTATRQYVADHLEQAAGGPLYAHMPNLEDALDIGPNL